MVGLGQGPHWGAIIPCALGVTGAALAAFGSPVAAVVGATMGGAALVTGAKFAADANYSLLRGPKVEWNSPVTNIAGITAAVASFVVASPMLGSVLSGAALALLGGSLIEGFKEKQASPNINAQTASREGTIISSQHMAQSAAR